MLAALLPLFDEEMAVGSYSLFSQKENKFLNPFLISTGINDSVGRIEGLDIIENVGMTTLSGNKSIFVPVNNISLFTDIDSIGFAQHSKLVLLIDTSVAPTEMYAQRIRELKALDFKFAICKLRVRDFEEYRIILSLMDYIYLDYTKVDITKARIYFNKVYPNIKLIAENIQSIDDFETLRKNGDYHLFEGPFYRLPITKGDTRVAPIKINYIQLINTVNDPDFNLTDAADIISRDTALVISLLKMVNNISINSKITSIRHAAAMLGQKELKKWITTAVTKELCYDKPNEIMRLSLIRAKFAENLAESFDMKIHEQELFLMGLFSVLDIILSTTMSVALDMVNVEKPIYDALLNNSGDFYKVLNFIQVYDNADFSEINRLEIVDNIDTSKAYDAYKDALVWFEMVFRD